MRAELIGGVIVLGLALYTIPGRLNQQMEKSATIEEAETPFKKQDAASEGKVTASEGKVTVASEGKTTPISTQERGRMPIVFKTFIINYPQDCKVSSLNVNENDMRADVDCNGESKLYKWHVSAIGKTISMVPFSGDGDVSVTALNQSGVD